MLVILKRGGILFLALLVIISFFLFTLRKEPLLKTAAKEGDIIVIDAGHGGPDGGAVGNEIGVLEKDLNLAIAKKVAACLRERGATVLETRTEDIGLYETENASLREKKREDMKKRVAIVSEGSLLVSIHMNHFTDPKYSGPQVFYQKGSAESESLAEEIRRSFLETIGPHCTRETKPVDNLYLLRQTKVPAALVECGFLSNPKEEALLMDEAYQEKLATAIADAIMRFKNGA